MWQSFTASVAAVEKGSFDLMGHFLDREKLVAQLLRVCHFKCLHVHVLAFLGAVEISRDYDGLSKYLIQSETFSISDLTNSENKIKQTETKTVAMKNNESRIHWVYDRRL